MCLGVRQIAQADLTDRAIQKTSEAILVFPTADVVLTGAPLGKPVELVNEHDPPLGRRA